jgi:hypothetical protein
MRTLVRFALRAEDRYRDAFHLLAHAGFHRQRAPEAGECETFPAAVVADLLQEPAVVSRAVFEALHDAGYAPVAVVATHVHAARAPRPARALALA